MSPSTHIAQLLEQARQHTTPYAGGALKWQQWPGPENNRPLLLLHGGFGSWTHWVANILALREGRTLWTLDMPGLGASGDMPEPYTLEHFARIILEGFDALTGQERGFDLAGFSFGALVGAQLAALTGDRCKHLVTCGAVGFGALQTQVELLRPPRTATPPEEARRITYTNLHRLMFAREDVIDELAIHVHADNLARARFNSRVLARDRGFVDCLAEIEASLCGIWGAEDATASGVDAITQREALFRAHQPACAFHVLENTGHWAMYEAPARFNALLESALAT